MQVLVIVGNFLKFFFEISRMDIDREKFARHFYSFYNFPVLQHCEQLTFDKCEPKYECKLFLQKFNYKIMSPFEGYSRHLVSESLPKIQFTSAKILKMSKIIQNSIFKNVCYGSEKFRTKTVVTYVKFK